jgi:hypothetical protein
LGFDFIEVLWDGLDRLDASGLSTAVETAVDEERDGQFPKLSERGLGWPPQDLPVLAVAASEPANQR